MYFWISCCAAGASIGLLCRLFLNPVQEQRHSNSDPEHKLLRLIWPWVVVSSVVSKPFVSWKMRHALERSIRLAGLNRSLWLPERFVALQLLVALLVFAIAGLGVFGVTSVQPISAICIGCVAGCAGALWLRLLVRDQGRRRQAAMLREFPFLLDMTTLCVEAGLNLNGAFTQAATHSPPGALRQELRYMLADMRAGVTRRDALDDLARRTELPALRHLVSALVQADLLGTSLGPLLRAQSEQRRSERFLHAEKLAMEAPVKMLFPLVFCIFPCTFLIIGFPIAMKLMALAA